MSDDEETIVLLVKKEQLQIDYLKRFSATVQNKLAKKPRKFILDLKDINYLDSAALGHIFKIKDTIDSFNGSFFITGVNKTISMVLSITKADRIIKILDSVEEALKIKVD